MAAVRPGFDRFLSVRSAYDASFSPDGERVAFIGDYTGAPELWAVPVEGGWPDQLTFFRDRVMTGRYSPLRDEILVGRDVGGNEREQLFLLREEGADLDQLTDAPDAIHTFGAWSPDGERLAYSSNARNPFFFDIYLRDMRSGATRRVLERDGTWHAYAFSPDGRSLLVARVNRSGDNDLFLLDLHNPSAEPVHLTPHTDFAQYATQTARPQFDPDGRRIWCISDQDADFAALGYIDVGARRFTPVAAPEWDVELLAVSPEGRIAYAVNVDGYSELRLRDADGDDRPIEGLPRGVITFLAWSPDGDRLAITLTTATRPQDIWLFEPNGEVRQLTRSPRGGLRPEELVEPETIRYPTFDGRQIPAFFYRPRGSGPFPCVVHVHGGPESQVRPTWIPQIQYFVSRGYAVLAPNVRGSTGYGKAYSHLDDQERRMDAVADLEAAWRCWRGRAWSIRGAWP